MSGAFVVGDPRSIRQILSPTVVWQADIDRRVHLGAVGIRELSGTETLSSAIDVPLRTIDVLTPAGEVQETIGEASASDTESVPNRSEGEPTSLFSFADLEHLTDEELVVAGFPYYSPAEASAEAKSSLRRLLAEEWPDL